MIYATQNQNIFEIFYSFPVWTIEENYLSCAKRLTMKQITDKSIETAGDDAGQISARAEIRKVSELLGRRGD